MGTFIDPSDLAPFADIDSAEAEAMIEDAEAQAALLAPCLDDLDPNTTKFKAVRAILRRAILRWNEAGSGATTTTQRGAGPYQEMTVVDHSRKSRGAFWPSEIQQLQSICRDESKTIFTMDTAPSLDGEHLLWCSLRMGATYCSCGASVAGHPIYGVG